MAAHRPREPGGAALGGRRVLTTDAQERSVLASARSLDHAGFHVTAVATTRTAPGLWSSAVDRRFLAADPRRSIESFISKLEEIVRAERHDVVLPGTDASLLAISLHRDRLLPYVRLGLPSHEVVERAFDRAAIARAASSAGLDVPDSQICSGCDEAVAAAERFGWPVMVKPLRNAVARDDEIQRWGSVVAQTPGTVRAAAGRFGSCVVQRRVPGRLLAVGGVATEGGVLAEVVSRSVRTWPIQGGSGSFSETISAPPALTARVATLIAELGWAGLFQVQLLERANGAFSAIDFNPRVYGSLSLAVAAGAPLPALWCQWLLGGRPASPSVRVGARYRWEDAELRHFARSLADGKCRSALAVVTPRRGVVHAYFQLRDPAPALARAAQLGKLVVERRQQRARR